MVRPTLALCLILLGIDALAQQPGMPGSIQRPGPLPGGREQRPARDPRDTPTGTAVIRGRIVAADTGAPIRRAQVRAFSGEIRESRMASTDAQGRFELRDLPAGRWELMASKAGFVTLRFGQRRPLESGRPIEISDGETMAKADMALPRGAAITGRILDEFGDPVAGTHVTVMRYQPFQGTRRLVPAGRGDQTDDTGAFRIYGLTPGDYYVTATMQGGMFADDSSDTTSYAPTYYPGTGNVAEAQRVPVTLGQELANITFALLPSRAVRISGTVVDSRGQRVTNGFVMLQDSSETSVGMFMQRGGGRVRQDGSFTISNVTPGNYTLFVNSGMMGLGGDDNEMATQPVTVGNEDVAGVHLVLSRGATVTGTVLAAEGSAGNLNTGGLMVMQQPARSEAFMMGMRQARVEPDGTFKISGIQGRRLFRINGLPPTWTLSAVVLNGSDITDTAVELKSQEEVIGLQILVTDRVSEVNGRVTNAKGDPTRDYTVVIFPEDSTKWSYPSRFVRTGRADQEGLYKIRGLPSEDRYLAVAVDYLEEGEGSDPQFLEEMKDRGTRLALGQGEVKALDLKLVNR